MALLPPTQREKKHYMAFEVSGKHKTEAVRETVNQAILKYIGELGYARAGPIFVSLKQKSRPTSLIEGILSVQRGSVRDVRAALVLLDRVAGKQALCRVKGVSGTLLRLRKKFM